MSKGSALFVTWDGPGSEYLTSLYLPLLARVARPVSVVQFTYGSRGQRERAARVARQLRVGYIPLALPGVSGAGPVALAHLIAAAPRLVRVVRRIRPEVIMARSVLPAGVVLAARAGFDRRVGFVFDADGLVQDERVDFAGWSPAGLRYRGLRGLEFQALISADAVLTRTRRARDILEARRGPGTPIAVVPNGKDDAVFRPLDGAQRRAARVRFGLPPHAPVVIYAGALGPQYYPKEMFDVFWRLRARRPEARFLVLTRDTATARELAGARSAEAVTIDAVEAHEVPTAMGASDLGIALRSPSFSQRAVSPVKVGEYLLSGLPVIATAGVGDIDLLLGEANATKILDAVDATRLEEAAAWAAEALESGLPCLRREARELGATHFGLGSAAAGYGAAFDEAAAAAIALRAPR